MSEEILKRIIRPEKAAAVKKRQIKMDLRKVEHRLKLAKYNPAFAPKPVEDPAAEKRRRRLERQAAHRHGHHHHGHHQHHGDPNDPNHKHEHHQHHEHGHGHGHGHGKHHPHQPKYDEYGLEIEPEISNNHAAGAGAVDAQISSSSESSDSSSSSDDEQAVAHTAPVTMKSAKEIISEIKTGRLTCMPGPEWRLVYVGNGNTYACTNVVSDEALLSEPRLTADVSFCVQTLGLEYPVRCTLY